MNRHCLLPLGVILSALSSFAAAQTCPVTYTIVNSWPGGFQAGITIDNTGTTPISNWTLEWVFPGNQQVSQLWGGNVTSQGETITVTNLSWDGSIPVGGTMNSVGFTATGTAATPAAIMLNGVACGSGGSSGGGGGGGSAPDVTVTINPASTQPISPWIYGINAGTIPNIPKVTITRLGGNRWTAYNWTTNASNAGSDFNYESDNFLSSSGVAGEAVTPTIAADIAGGMATLMTVQLQGLVSADENGPVSIANPPDLTRFDPVVDQKSTVSAAPFTTTPLTTGPVFMDEFAWAMNQDFLGTGIFGGSTATPPSWTWITSRSFGVQPIWKCREPLPLRPRPISRRLSP